MMAMDPDLIEGLEARISYAFVHKRYLVRALTHPSHNQLDPRAENNQRLEFLGDAVLGLVLAERLFNEFPDEREGVLTRYRALLVNGEQLVAIAREIDLGKFLRLGESERSQGGHDRPSILEDALEALIGAVYLDGGMAGAQTVITRLFGDLGVRLETKINTDNPKGRLQEQLQPDMGNEAIEYRVVEESGPDHNKHFRVEVWIEGVCTGYGEGNSKRAAEKAAARTALRRLPGSS